jgi:hypothetical protein
MSVLGPEISTTTGVSAHKASSAQFWHNRLIFAGTTFAGRSSTCRIFWRRAGDSNSQGPRGPVDFKSLKRGDYRALLATVGSNLRSLDHHFLKLFPMVSIGGRWFWHSSDTVLRASRPELSAGLP